MDLPKKLKISGSTWSVQFINGLLNEWGLHGRTDPSSQTILIGTDQHPEQMRKTMLHEALHACLSVSGGTLGYDTEELLVRQLEPALMSLLVDNPVFVALLTGKPTKKGKRSRG